MSSFNRIKTLIDVITRSYKYILFEIKSFFSEVKKRYQDEKSIKFLVKCVIAVLTLMLLVFIVPLIGFYGEDAENQSVVEYQVFYYFLSLCFTILVIFIAYFQFNGVKRRMKADFLMNIDNRWSSAEIIKARKLIHSLIIKNEKKYGQISDKNNWEKIAKDVGKEILELRKSTDSKNGNKFMILLNFLEFMETIGYLYKMEYVDKDELDELCGHSLIFNYTVFEEYIYNKNKRHSKIYYADFKNLHDKLKEKYGEKEARKGGKP